MIGPPDGLFKLAAEAGVDALIPIRPSPYTLEFAIVTVAALLEVSVNVSAPNVLVAKFASICMAEPSSARLEQTCIR